MTSVTFTLVLTLLFVQLCFQPIWHTDVWGHLSYGRNIWQSGSLPSTEPLLRYSQHVPFVDSPWLCQLIGYGVVSTPRLQLAGLQGLFAITVTSCAALIGLSVLRQTGSLSFSLLAIGIFIIPGWRCLLILRPQLAGVFCFVYVLTQLNRPRLEHQAWYLIPGVFVLWANLHPSFPVGLGLLACFCLGRLADRFIKAGSFSFAVRDRRVRRLLVWTLTSAAAVFITPYGWSEFREILRVSANPNLQDLTEWQALPVREPQGQTFVGSVLVLCILFHWTPRRIGSWEVVTCIGLGIASLWSSRMLVWWIPICGFLIPLHAFAVWRKWRHWPLVIAPARRSTIGAFVCAAIAGTGLLWSPLGQAMVFNRHAEPARSVSSFTPLFAAEYLSENPPEGMVFATYEWSDYLQWAGPPELDLLLNSHAHLIPRNVWMGYMQVIELRSGWKETLDDFGVNTIVIDRANRTPLILALDADASWRRLTEERDGQVLFQRRGQRSVDAGLSVPEILQP